MHKFTVIFTSQSCVLIYCLLIALTIVVVNCNEVVSMQLNDNDLPLTNWLITEEVHGRKNVQYNKCSVEYNKPTRLEKWECDYALEECQQDPLETSKEKLAETSQTMWERGSNASWVAETQQEKSEVNGTEVALNYDDAHHENSTNNFFCVPCKSINESQLMHTKSDSMTEEDKKLEIKLMAVYIFLLLVCGAFVIWISSIFYKQYRLALRVNNEETSAERTVTPLYDNILYDKTGKLQKDVAVEHLSWSYNNLNNSKCGSSALNTSSTQCVHLEHNSTNNTWKGNTTLPCQNYMNTIIYDTPMQANITTPPITTSYNSPRVMSPMKTPYYSMQKKASVPETSSSSSSSLRPQSPLSELAAEEEADKQRMLESVEIAKKVHVVSVWLKSLPENHLSSYSTDANGKVSIATSISNANNTLTCETSHNSNNVEASCKSVSLESTRLSQSTENTFEKVITDKECSCADHPEDDDIDDNYNNNDEIILEQELNNGRPAVSYNSVEERNIETLNNTKDVPLAEHHELQINMTNDNLNKENNSSYLYNAQDVEKEKSESHQSSYSNSNNNSNSNNCSSTDGTDANKKEAIEEVERLLASPIKGGYNDEYQQRIRTMTRALAMDEANAAPFIGFSLAQYAESQTLVVDGLFKDGPAYQTGIRIGDELLRIADKPVSSIENVREVVAKYCHCGRITDFTLRHPHGEEYTVQLWIMTVEPQFTGQPYFFDVSTHKREESPSRKRYVVGSDELEEIIHVTPHATQRRGSEISIDSCPELIATQLFSDNNPRNV